MSNFVTQNVNDWGEVTYTPTSLGNTILGLLIVLLLVLAAVIGKKISKSEKKEFDAKKLAFCAMALSLGTVLSNMKLFHFPTGGSITLLSMLVIALPGYFFGLVPGLLTGVAYGIFQMTIDPYILFPAQLVIDYLLAFGALGLSGLFANSKNGLLKGYIAALLGRFVFSVISGWIFFGEYAWEGWGALPYSLAYNAIYIFAEGIITIIVLSIPSVKEAIQRIKVMANN